MSRYYSFAGIAHSLLGHRCYYEKSGQRVCKGCHMAQAYIKGEWRSLGIIVGWREPGKE